MCAKAAPMKTTRRAFARYLPLLPLFAVPAGMQACSSDDATANPVDAGQDAPLTDHSVPPADAPVTPPAEGGTDAKTDAPAVGLARINHIVVIYMENHSFDNLYGEFAGAEGVTALDAAAPNVAQVDEAGAPMASLLPPKLKDGGPDPRFPATLPNAPFSIEEYVPADAAIPDLHHIFFTEQHQINDGGMNNFALWSDSRGLAMGYYRTANLPIAIAAKDYTVCDHFHHAAFGGSFLNHQWLIAARTPEYTGVPDGGIDDPSKLVFGAGESPYAFDTADNKWYAVNTAFSGNSPHPFFPVSTPLVPDQTYDTIGDRLTEKSLDWAWFAGGWDDALAASADAGIPDGGLPPKVEQFQYHHQPFVYFAKYADGTAERTKHLKDESEFVSAAKAGTLPAVSFVKPVGVNNEHPGYTDVITGELHVMDLINAVKNGPNWKDTAIIITYDEHGGFWDHVAPPAGDKWGPGARVPTILISPFAKTGFVDHTVYDTTSILATIEHRWALAPLTARDTAAKDLSAAFDFTK